MPSDVTSSTTPDESAQPAVSQDVTVDANPRVARTLFLFPAVIGGIVLLALALYFAASALTRETSSADVYLESIKTAGGNRRWQAAYELSSLLERGEAKVQPGTAEKALQAFKDARADSDPRIRRYLALALGRLEDHKAVDELADAVKDPDAETRIYSALALGRIADRRATPALTAALSDEDAGVRKASAYALGNLMDPASGDPLRDALHDGEVDVTWNAAVALARMGDPSGAEVLRSMVDRDFVERASQSEDAASRAAVIVTGIHALAMIEDKEAIPALRKLANGDRDLQVRQAALEALQKIDPARR